MLHMQHHFLCNISYVVIAEPMGKSLAQVYNNGVCNTLYTILMCWKV